MGVPIKRNPHGFEEGWTCGKRGNFLIAPDYEFNLISAPYFFTLTRPLDVQGGRKSLEPLIRCPFGTTMFTIGFVKLKWKIDDQEGASIFTVVSDPDLENRVKFDVVLALPRKLQAKEEHDRITTLSSKQ